MDIAEAVLTWLMAVAIFSFGLFGMKMSLDETPRPSIGGVVTGLVIIAFAVVAIVFQAVVLAS